MGAAPGMFTRYARQDSGSGTRVHPWAVLRAVYSTPLLHLHPCLPCLPTCVHGVLLQGKERAAVEDGGTVGHDGVPPAAPDACAGPEGAAGGGGASTTKQVGAAGGASSLRVWPCAGRAATQQAACRGTPIPPCCFPCPAARGCASGRRPREGGEWRQQPRCGGGCWRAAHNPSLFRWHGE